MRRRMSKITSLVLICLFITCASAWAASARQISQFGITWTFDREYEYGRFANGDYWVVGPVRIVSIDPPSREINGRTRHGAMLNPSPAKANNRRGCPMQGYDSSYRLWDTYHQPYYDADLNVALNVGAGGRTLVLPAGSSLVSSISRNAADATPQLKTAAILTVLGASAPEGSFRPPYAGDDKTIRFNKSDLNYSLLARLAPVAGTPRLAQRPGDPVVMYDAGHGLPGYDIYDTSVERQFERPWLDHMMLERNFARQLHPYENMPDYRREISDVVGTAALMLHLDFTNQEKETLLIRFVQLGIDYYQIAWEGRYQYSRTNSAGFMEGRKWPIIFAGLMLNDQRMMDIGRLSGDYYGDAAIANPPSDYIPFGEDLRSFYVSQHVIDYGVKAPRVGYTRSDLGLPDWMRYAWDRYFDKRWAEQAYRTTTGNCVSGSALAALIMGAKKLWNHDVFFDYRDRFMEVELQLHGAGSWRRQWSRFPEQMWDTYRRNYRPYWTRDNPNDIYSNGHYIGKEPDYLYGDVSENGNISAYDASLAAQYAVGLINLDSDQITKADVTGNGSVSAMDASWIARKAVEPAVVFPVE